MQTAKDTAHLLTTSTHRLRVSGHASYTNIPLRLWSCRTIAISTLALNIMELLVMVQYKARASRELKNSSFQWSTKCASSLVSSTG